MKPAGCRGKLAMPYVAVAVVLLVKLNTEALVVPPRIVTLATVRLPTLLVVPPNVRVVLPSVMVLLARPLLGMVVDAVTFDVPLAYMYPVRADTEMLTKLPESPPSTFYQILPLNTAQSPTPHKVVPSRFVEPATDTT